MPPRKACDVCFKRKIQCSIPSAGPPCDWCSNQNISCTFARPPQRKKPSPITPEVVDALNRRVQQLEADLARRDAADQASAANIDVRLEQISPAARTEEQIVVNSGASPLENGHAAKRLPRLSRHQLGRNWYFRGIQILSRQGQKWIEVKTGQAMPLDSHVMFGVQNGWQAGSTEAGCPAADSNAIQIPSKQATHALAETFFNSTAQFSFPFLDQLLMNATIDDAYSPASSLPAQACVWALHAWTRWLTGSAASQDGLNATECAVQCKSILQQIDWAPSLEALQAILLLIYQNSQTHIHGNKTLLAIACQMVCDLGGHYNPSAQDSETPLEDGKRRYLRALFWSCYILDKEFALRSGQPALLTEEYCDVIVASLDENSGQRRLSLLKEKTCRLLYSPLAEKYTDAETLHYIRQLDHELEQWRLSIPALIRPRLSISGDGLTGVDVGWRKYMQIIILQLEYHCALISIHTMVRKCGARSEETELPEDLHSVIHSSVDLSLEAARSTLKFLRFPLKLLGSEALRCIQSYAPVAAMALFVNVLVHPLGESAQADLEILMQAVGMFQTIPIAALSQAETQEVQRLNEFIMELVRLASCAIWKTKTSGVMTNR